MNRRQLTLFMVLECTKFRSQEERKKKNSDITEKEVVWKLSK
jgi:hypothetical protein